MKFTKYTLLVMLLISVSSLHSMQDIRRDFSTPGKDVVILVPQNDESGFVVDLDLAKNSKTLNNLIEDTGIDNPLPLPNVEPKVLERLLLLVNKGILSENLSFNSLVRLLRAEDYLDMEAAREPLLKAAGDALTWDQGKLNLIFTAGLPYKYENYLVKTLMDKVGSAWDEKMLRELLTNYQITLENKLGLVKELIKQKHALLIELVPEWRVHAQKCKERGKDPMMCAYRGTKLTEEDIVFHSNFKKLLGTDYETIKNQLLAEYPEE